MPVDKYCHKEKTEDEAISCYYGGDGIFERSPEFQFFGVLAACGSAEAALLPSHHR